MGLFSGHRPDITPAQVTALVVAGVPIVSKVLAAYGVYSPTPEQLGALSDASGWAVGAAAALVLGDAGVRAARNAKDARVEGAAFTFGGQPPVAPEAVLEPLEDVVEELPSDDEEFGHEPESRRLPEDPERGGL